MKKQKTQKIETTPGRSNIMRAIKSTNTRPEQTVRAWLKAAKFKPVEHAAFLPGKPDFAFPRRKIAIFVHGCFWHGHSCPHGSRKPKTNAAYWRGKIARNKVRDASNIRMLKKNGWRVLVVWECRLQKSNTAENLITAIRKV